MPKVSEHLWKKENLAGKVGSGREGATELELRQFANGYDGRRLTRLIGNTDEITPFSDLGIRRALAMDLDTLEMASTMGDGRGRYLSVLNEAQDMELYAP